ncbi:MAG: alpha-E domain-containing protein [Phototrophicaceae bacterium]
MTEQQPMLSRVADSLYWMSRYLERAEHTARLINVHLNNMLEIEHSREADRLQRLLDTLNMDTDNLASDDVMQYLVFDNDNSASIAATVASARENARQVRDQFSSEMWTQLNKLYLQVQHADTTRLWYDSPHNYLTRILDGSHLFQGVTDATMNHNQGWQFIQIGRYIERALDLLILLDVHFGEVPTGEHDISTEHYFDLVGTLKSVSAFEAYCKVYNPNVRSDSIIEFLLFNQEFPRSLRFCIDNLLVALNTLADATGRTRNAKLYRLSGRLQSNLSFDEIADIDNLPTYIDNIKQQIYQIHDTLYDTYISYTIETAL